jgi:hypothetical protein
MNSSGNWLEGSCHCSGARFRVRLASNRALQCNCSICSKKGFINLIVKPEDFDLLRGEELLSSYRFNTRIAEHRFCSVCGIHPFSRPRSHPGSFDANGRCLDVGLEALEVREFDGRNWEESVASITGKGHGSR